MLGELVVFPWHWFLLPILVIGVSALIFSRLSKVLLSTGFVALLLLGAGLMQWTRQSGTTIQKGEVPRIAIVQEAENSDKIWKKVIVRLKQEKSKKEWKRVSQEVLVYSQYQFREGDVLLFKTELNAIKNAGNPGEFDAKSYWNGKNIYWMGFVGEEDFTLLDYQEPSWIAGVFRSTRRYLSEQLDRSLPKKEASVARALLLGDKSKLSSETRESFGNAGAMHVLAISGLHVGIIMYLLFFVLKSASRWVSRNVAVLITVLFLWVFAGVTGWSPSVVRATLMFSLLLTGQQLGRSSNAMNTLFFSAFLILLIDPLTLFDIGFQLSYGAMFGIFIFFNRIKMVVQPRNRWLEKAWEGTALGISAQLFTIPLVLYHFHQFPNYFWLTNLGILCFAGVILALGMIFFLVHGIPFVRVIIVWLLGCAIFVLTYFIEWVDTLPWGVAQGFELYTSEIVLFIAVMITLTFVYDRKWGRWSLIFLLVLMVGSWQWDRHEATVKSEWVVFNSNAPVIACKQGNEIHAFFTGKREKAKRLIDAYAKVHPGKVTLDSLKEDLTQLKWPGGFAELERRKNGIELSTKNAKVFLRTRYVQLENAYDYIIDMPYLSPTKNHINLARGAFRRTL